MPNQFDMQPVARIVFQGTESIYPGWYLQRYVGGALESIRLEVSRRADAHDAIVEAAGYVGCMRDQIQLEGAPLPPPRSPI